MKLQAVRNRNKYYITTKSKQKRYPSQVYPFKYYKLDLFVSKAFFSGSIFDDKAYWDNIYRVTERITGFYFGKSWETPEQAKIEAIKILRKTKHGKTNYERALIKIAKFKKI